MGVMLTREIRFGLHENASESAVSSRGANGFAGNPMLAGIGPFLTLRATVAGEVDGVTGMMVNIKEVDKTLRAHAVPVLREWHYGEGRGAAGILVELLRRLGGGGRFVPHELVGLRLGVSPYLAFGIWQKEPDVVELALKFEFSAAHRLHAAGMTAAENLDVFGRCNNANGHGHNYEVEVVVSGTVGEGGQVMAIGKLQEIVNRSIIEPFDHKHLNLDCAEFGPPPGGLNPTVENIAGVLYRRLKPGIPGPAKLAAVRVWETPKTMCEYRE